LDGLTPGPPPPSAPIRAPLPARSRTGPRRRRGRPAGRPEPPRGRPTPVRGRGSPLPPGAWRGRTPRPRRGGAIAFPGAMPGARARQEHRSVPFPYRRRLRAMFDDPLVLARLQFALTAARHYMFVAFTLGLAPYILVTQFIEVLRQDAARMRAVRFWGGLYLVNYGMG